MLKEIIKLLRPHQWVKNFFVFAGLVFAGRLLHIDEVLATIYAFAIFCMVASGVYVFNDIVDRRQDAHHPRKKYRPIAAGTVPVWLGVILVVVLWWIGVFWAWHFGLSFALLIISYIVLHIVYSVLLKRIVIWDLMVVSAGFVLRAVGGAMVIGVVISSWLLVCTSLLALFLITAKRRAELANWEGSKEFRPVLEHYTVDFLNSLILVLVASTMTSYTLYVFSPDTIARLGTRGLGLTIPFVFYGLFRYLYLIMRSNSGENPEHILFRDRAFLINILLWILTVVAVLYHSKF